MSGILDEAKKLEQKSEASAGTNPGSGAVTAPAEEIRPVLEYTEMPETKAALNTNPSAPPKPQYSITVLKKRSFKGVIAFVLMAAFAGLGYAAYSFGVLDSIIPPNLLRLENITESPEGAKAPAFIPIDPAEFANTLSGGELIAVPDETGLDLPSFDDESPSEVPATPQNYYIQTPNVSGLYTRAAQDESYVYFLEAPTGKLGLSNLMRVRISSGKIESIANANEVEDSIYSFTLFGQNIITCEYRQKDDVFAFYRVPKSGEDAQLLFEHSSPALMNVHDNKIFMLFVEDEKLGVFDPSADTRPALIDLESVGDQGHYFPQFSVMNGYLYHGIWYDEGEHIEYLRRSLYTGEIVSLLSAASGDVIMNPCWDNEGGAYYVQYDSEASAFSLVAHKSGGLPATVSAVDFAGDWPPVALRDESLVVAVSPDKLCKYDMEDLSAGLEIEADELPFAATKDFLVTFGGLYRIFDLSFIKYYE